MQIGVSYYIHPDHLGTPRVIADQSGRTVWRWDSEPFGSDEANEDPWRHRDSHHYKMRGGVLGFLVVSVASSCVFAEPEERSMPVLCARDQTVSCLKRNFYVMQEKNRPLFWEIVRASARGAVKCQSSDRVVEFLSLARLGRGSAEFEEFLSENIEQLAVQQGECLLNALTICDEDTKHATIQMLANPLFAGPGEIDHLFYSATPEVRYRPLSELYFAFRGKDKEGIEGKDRP